FAERADRAGELDGQLPFPRSSRAAVDLAARQRLLATRGGFFFAAHVAGLLPSLGAVGPHRGHVGQSLAAAFFLVAATLLLPFAGQRSATASLHHPAHLFLRVFLFPVAIDLFSQSLQRGG